MFFHASLLIEYLASSIYSYITVCQSIPLTSFNASVTVPDVASQKSSGARKNYGLRLDQVLMRELSHLAVDEDRWLNELVEEAVRDLIKKYKDKEGGPL